MEVFWLIISTVVGFFSLCIFLWANSVKHGDQKYWDETYEELNKNRPIEMPEETVYNIIMKCHTVSGIILCINIIIMAVCILNLI